MKTKAQEGAKNQVNEGLDSPEFYQQTCEKTFSALMKSAACGQSRFI